MTERICSKCKSKFERVGRQIYCKRCERERYYNRTPERRLFDAARARCRKSGMDFTISIEDISVPDKCPVLGVKFPTRENSRNWNKVAPSLDRIDNSKGYIPDNIQVISNLANTMKSSASREQLLRFADWIYKQ